MAEDANPVKTPSVKEFHMYRYKAFISYHHSRQDKKIASRIQNVIEHFRLPGTAGTDAAKNHYSVFRDETELSLSSDLNTSLKEALDQSEFLIVICSEETRKSAWVLEEIEYFLITHDYDHILTVLVSGNAAEVCPEPLLEVKRENGTVIRKNNPLSANLTDENGNYKASGFKRESVRILAALSSVSFDTLWQRERRYRARRHAVFFGIAAAFLLIIAALSVRYSINISQRDASIRRQNALASADNAEFQLDSGDDAEAMAFALNSLSSDPNGPKNARAQQVLVNASGAYVNGYGSQLLCTLSADIRQMLPTADRKSLILLDAENNLRCIDLSSGETVWENHDLISHTSETDPDSSYYQLYRTSDDSVVILTCSGAAEWTAGIQIKTGKTVWATDCFHPLSWQYSDEGCDSAVSDTFLFAAADDSASTLTLYLRNSKTGEILHTISTGIPADDGPLRYNRNDSSCCMVWDKAHKNFILAFRNDSVGADEPVWYFLRGNENGICTRMKKAELPGDDAIYHMTFSDSGTSVLVLHQDLHGGGVLTMLDRSGETEAEQKLIAGSGLSANEDILVRIVPLAIRNDHFTMDAYAVITGNTTSLLTDELVPSDVYRNGNILAVSASENALFLYTEENRIYGLAVTENSGIDSSEFPLGGLEYSMMTVDKTPAYKACSPDRFPWPYVSAFKDGYQLFYIRENDHRSVYRIVPFHDPEGQTVLTSDKDISAASWISGTNTVAAADSGGNIFFLDGETFQKKDTFSVADKTFVPNFLWFLPDKSGSFLNTGSSSFKFYDNVRSGELSSEGSPFCSYSACLAGQDGIFRHFTVHTEETGSFSIALYENGQPVSTTEGLKGYPFPSGSQRRGMCAAGQNGWLITGLYPDDESTRISSFLAWDYRTSESRTIHAEEDISRSRGLAVAESADEFSVVTDDYCVIRYSIMTGKAIGSMKYPHMSSAVFAASYTNDDRYLLLFTKDSLTVFDLSSRIIAATDEYDFPAALIPSGGNGTYLMKTAQNAANHQIYLFLRKAGEGSGLFLVLDTDTLGISTEVNEVLDFQENPARLLCKGYKGRTYALYQYPIYSKEELMRKAGEFADRSPADGHYISG